MVANIAESSVVLINTSSFEGLSYDSDSGTLVITKNGQLDYKDPQVLYDFLGIVVVDAATIEQDLNKVTEQMRLEAEYELNYKRKYKIK